MLVEMEWLDQECYKDYEISTTCYGEAEINFENVTMFNQKETFLEQVVIS